MDKENYEQLSLPAISSRDSPATCCPNIDVQINFYNGRPIGVDIPIARWLTVVDTEPASRSHRHQYFQAGVRWRPGITVQVPHFIKRARRSRSIPTQGTIWRGPEARRVGKASSQVSRLLPHPLQPLRAASGNQC